ncbi:MAG: CDGSH iron-sulfur domain-containing protein [Aquihabitans sp.]
MATKDYEGEATASEAAADPVALIDASCTITPRRNGPLMVEGPVTLVGADGSSNTVDRLFLCRCGSSADKPQCDGTHKRTGFEAPGLAPTSRAAQSGVDAHPS